MGVLIVVVIVILIILFLINPIKSFISKMRNTISDGINYVNPFSNSKSESEPVENKTPKDN